jgi:hypothetical protein
MDDDLYPKVYAFGDVASASHHKHQDHTKGWEEMSFSVTQLCPWVLVEGFEIFGLT